MGVLTAFYRLAPAELRDMRTKPEVLSHLFGRTDDEAVAGSWLYLDKAWDDLLILLEGTGERAAHSTLDIDADPELSDADEIRVWPCAAVARGAATLTAVSPGRVRELAIRRELRGYDGDPMEYLLDHLLSYLAQLAAFWRDAATAGQTIISSTG